MFDVAMLSLYVVSRDLPAREERIYYLHVTDRVTASQPPHLAPGHPPHLHLRFRRTGLPFSHPTYFLLVNVTKRNFKLYFTPITPATAKLSGTAK